MWLILVCLTTILTASLSANILSVVPIPARSHNILFHNIVKALAERGHNVTFVSNVLLEKNAGNLTQIHLPIEQSQVLASMNINAFDLRFESALGQIIVANNYGVQVSDRQLGSKPMQELLASNSQFDVVITQAMFSESILAGLSYRFQAPSIAISNLQPNLWCNYLVGNVAPTSYTAHPSMGFSTKMTFQQRALNFLYDSLGTLHMNWFSLPQHEKLLIKYFGKDVPPLLDIVKNTSLVLTNDHLSLTYPRPLAPNVIPIGGVHVAPAKKLPPHLEEYMNNSEHGVILFSMGSILKGSLINPEKIKIFFQVFSKLKQNILWKFEKDLPGKPDNVLLSKWLPQNDILAHPNLKLFITHGGILSTIEAVNYGVPVVGIPVFLDQPINMKNTVHAGTGLSVDYDQLSAESLYEAIQEVINNPKYREAAKQRSKLLNDQPMSPIETCVWWIEYVIRHKGATHLRSTAQDLQLYELYQIDVILFLLSVILLAFWTVSKLFGCLVKKIKLNISEKINKND